MARQNAKFAANDIQNLFDPQGYQDVFKTWASMNERMTSIAVEAGTRATEITSETTKEALEALQGLEQEDLDAITGAINQLRSISETSQELSAIWWQATIKELTDTDIGSEDLPASLPFQSTIEGYLGHVQSVPFDFSQ